MVGFHIPSDQKQPRSHGTGADPRRATEYLSNGSAREVYAKANNGAAQSIDEIARDLDPLLGGLRLGDQEAPSAFADRKSDQLSRALSVF